MFIKCRKLYPKKNLSYLQNKSLFTLNMHMPEGYSSASFSGGKGGGGVSDSGGYSPTLVFYPEYQNTF